MRGGLANPRGSGGSRVPPGWRRFLSTRYSGGAGRLRGGGGRAPLGCALVCFAAVRIVGCVWVELRENWAHLGLPRVPAVPLTSVLLRFTGQRKGTPGIFSTHSRLRKEPVKMRMLDYAERNGYIKGVVTDIVHESGRGAPLAITKFRNPYKYKMDKHRLIAAEGTYTGQFIYAGKKCEWTMHARFACSAADVAALAASLGRGSLGSSGRWRWAAAGLGSQQVMRS
jgi:hypothetical protein